MIRDGEKFACEACIRGHRVSNCQHSDRPLHHINKKGRPVTQCQHCRSQRKNRSAHIKCDCGEKTTKCVHLGAKENHRESCCCNHGAKCSCGGLKNELEPVPETPSSGSDAGLSNCDSVPAAFPTSVAPKSPVRRSRANTSRSEGTLSFDENGRHKPLTQKHAKAASRKTLPYPTSRASMSRSTSHSHLNSHMLDTSFNEDEDLDDYLGNGNAVLGSAADETLANSAAAAGVNYVPAHLSQQQRRTRSEADSPSFFASSVPLPNQMGNSLTLSTGAFGDYSVNNSTFTNPFSSESIDAPLFSAGINPPSVDWAGLGLDFDRGFDVASDTFPDPLSMSHAAAYDPETNAPTMTTGTSGDVSEADDTNSGPPDFEQEFEADFDSHTDTASSLAFSRVNSNLHMSIPLVMGQATSPLGGDGSVLRDSKAGNQFLPTAAAGTIDDMATLFQDDDPSLWLADYNGLPTMTESPEPDFLFWGA